MPRKKPSKPTLEIKDLLEEPRPKALSHPENWQDVITGWACNIYRLRSHVPWDCVWPVWQRGDCQYTNKELRNGSRSLDPIYATRREAFVELAYRVRDECEKMQASLNEMAAKVEAGGW